jgi:acyl-CoA dehydrogenase
MMTLGGKLKLREKLTGRYADLLSHMYLAACVLRRYEAEGYRRDHRAVFEWAMRHCFAEIQVAFDGIFANLRVPGLTWLVRTIGLWARLNRVGATPPDALGHAIAQAIQLPGEPRESLSTGIVFSARPDDAGAKLERAFRLAHEAGAILQNIALAAKAGRLPRKRANLLVKEAVAAGVIGPDEAALLEQANAAREDAIRVDSFSLEEYRPEVLELAPAVRAVGP